MFYDEGNRIVFIESYRTMIKRRFLIVVHILLLCSLSCFYVNAADTPPVFKDGKLRITVEDLISHPLYWWPKTLLEFEILLPADVKSDDLVLINEETGAQHPFQLRMALRGHDDTVVESHTGTDAASTAETADGFVAETLYLISDLPSGGKRSFVLQKKSGTGTDRSSGNRIRPDELDGRIFGQFETMKVRHADGAYHVETDKLSIRIPASENRVLHESGMPDSTSSIPGPFCALARKGDKAFGQSRFAGVVKPERLTTTITGQGTLFTEFRLDYEFPQDAKYTVWLRCINGYDFVEMTEQMDGFPQGADVCAEFLWTDFAPTHRQAPNHPYGMPNRDTKGIERYNWEKIDQQLMESQHGITRAGADGKIPYEVGIYGNWQAELSVTSSVFWDENSNCSIGVFTRGIGNWNSRTYPIWLDARELSVKFYYRDSLLSWRYPIMNGTRTTGVSIYDHQKDKTVMDKLEELTVPIAANDKGMTYRVNTAQLSYNHFLQNRYSTLCLNEVKNWILTYPDSLTRPDVLFDNPDNMTPDQFEQAFFYGSFTNDLPVGGICQNSGYGPTSSRFFYEKWTPMMNFLYGAMTDDQRKRMTAIYLVHAYIAAGEEYMPMKNMLGGHPNFLADVKSVPGYAAFLFPKHPQAAYWADLFEKHVELNYRYHVRPDVERWDAKGGRWTENTGTYLWAALRPASRASYLLEHYRDGKKRMATEHISKMAQFVLNSLSAPFDGEQAAMYYDARSGKKDLHSWNLVTPEIGPARILPPQGAHSIRRRPPNNYWWLGKELENYDPLLSENIRYVARPDFDDFETESLERNSFKFMYPQQCDDTGTPPLLESVKMTGYGVVLRSELGTRDEISLHLMQIDNGPNYRWGIVGAGGGGSIYYYAGGKSYSNNGKEDIGDRKLGDTDLTTGFGAFRPGPIDPYIGGQFKSVGKNELERPMYDLGIAQFAEVTTSEKDDYISPYYKSRSVLLVGSDYFVVYDDVHNPSIGGRFSWFTHINDLLPELKVIKPSRYELSTHQSKESKGVWFDGSGDFLTFVSHKKGYDVSETAFGCKIITPDGQTDYVFRNDNPVEVHENGYTFSGTAGIIRKAGTDAGNEQWAVFHGTKIGNDRFEICPENMDAGLSAVYRSDEDIIGKFYALQDTRVIFRWRGSRPDKITLYMDGKQHHVEYDNNTISAVFPSGKHLWNITTGYPSLLRPEILYTRNIRGRTEMAINPVAGAHTYRYEYSTDQGQSWIVYKDTKSAKLSISPLCGETKGYVRVTAVNSDHQSEPSAIYPLYFTTKPPPHPDGLKVGICDTHVRISWGKVLGCNEYRLYKKTKGGSKYTLVYQGDKNNFSEDIPMGRIYEYRVCAVNGNGPGAYSLTVTTDPESLLNFDPMPGEPFRRSVTRDCGYDNDGIPVPAYYP
ncbi:MAG: fibronectin type III domain-containing protein [Tannerella sp.]|jgi:hypothetical protein|nr:fibronectin type III domain-containing protein [Tannerella sp.]